MKNCHSVLILSALSEDPNGLETSKLIQSLKASNKEVFVLMHKVNLKVEFSPQEPEIKIFDKSHLNGLSMPKDRYIQELIKREFDLLIDLTFKDEFALKYLHALSKSKLKVGAAVNYKNKYGDLLIELEEKPEIPYLVEQINHYLTQINQDQNVA